MLGDQTFAGGNPNCSNAMKNDREGFSTLLKGWFWEYGNAKVLQCCKVDSLPLVSRIWQSQRGSKIAIKSGQWSVHCQMYTAIVEGVKDCHKRKEKETCP